MAGGPLSPSGGRPGIVVVGVEMEGTVGTSGTSSDEPPGVVRSGTEGTGAVGTVLPPAPPLEVEPLPADREPLVADTFPSPEAPSRASRNESRRSRELLCNEESAE